ncbi:thymidine kinase [Nanobdella aerobiophila]|uniref:Thymidine kinase n=1 Tax=Nanobdella aerobiophila TaxID=2586965 RepID=A0A915SKI1_9ARCH|nr:AAA family ATPase [Nanobdella aerobiophila]BBL45653.1 thymidine kinase [Nanobdella aerobiophila]
MNDNEILKYFNLNDNPFRLEIILQTFVGYSLEREKLISSINGKEKIILISGPTGAGKTTLLLWTFNNLKIKNKIYIYRPFKEKSEFEDYIKEKFTIMEKILYKIKKYNLLEYLNKKNLIIFIDEATFFTDDMLEWIKILSDQTSCTFILSGLPELEERLLKEHRTLYERILSKIYLKSLDPESGKLLIKKRLEISGNPGLFTDDAIEEIYNLSGGLPREILKYSYEALLIAYRERKNIVDKSIIDKIYESKRPPTDILKLTEKQKYIIEIISKYGPKTVNELLKLFKERYNDATIHAISNILKRMVEYKYLTRTKLKGKFIYDVVPAIKDYFIHEINK